MTLAMLSREEELCKGLEVLGLSRDDLMILGVALFAGTIWSIPAMLEVVQALTPRSRP